VEEAAEAECLKERTGSLKEESKELKWRIDIQQPGSFKAYLYTNTPNVPSMPFSSGGSTEKG